MNYDTWCSEQAEKSSWMLEAYLQKAEEAKEDILGTDMWIEEVSNSAQCTGVSLSGPDGCGKHTAAAFLLKRLFGDDGISFLFIDGDEYEDDSEAASELRTYLKQFLDDAEKGIYYEFEDGNTEKHEEEIPMATCILFDNPMFIPNFKKIMLELARRACRYQLLADNQDEDDDNEIPGLFLIFISVQPVHVPTIIESNIRTCRFGLPGYEQRKEFRNYLGVEYAALEEKCPSEQFASLTDGLTYSQLRSTAANTNAMAQFMDAALIEEFIRSQASQKSQDSQNTVVDQQFAEKTQEFGERFLQVMEKIAENLKALPAAGTVSTYGNNMMTPALNDKQGTENAPVKNYTDAVEYKQHLESLAFNDLAIEVLGAGRVKTLNQETNCDENASAAAEV